LFFGDILRSGTEIENLFRSIFGESKMTKKRSEIVIVDDKVYHLGLAKGQLAKNVFIVGDPARAVRVSKRFDTIDLKVTHREYVTFTGSYRGLPVSVIGTGIGTDNVEIALIEAFIVNEFDFATGLREPDVDPLTVIRIGTSGGVQPEIAPGVLGIASYALGLDSSGLYYDHAAEDETVLEIEREALRLLENATPDGARFRSRLVPYASKASTQVAEALARNAQAEDAAFEVGITASTSSFYGASSRYIEGLSNTIPDIKHQLASLSVSGLRVVNMEMESSLLFHLCGRMLYPAGTICPIISNPNSSDSVVDYEGLIEKTITIALNAMLDLRLKTGGSENGKQNS
jgi:uridine phosphorylase